MVNTRPMFVDCKICTKFYPRSHNVPFVSKILVNLVGEPEASVCAPSCLEQNSLSHFLLRLSLNYSNPLMLEKVETFHQVEQEWYVEVLIGLRFRNSYRFAEEA